MDSSSEKRQSLLTFYRRVWPFMRPYRSRLVMGLLCGAGYAIATTALLVIGQVAIDAVFPGKNADSIEKQLRGLPQFLQDWAHHWMSQSATLSPRAKAILILSVPVAMCARSIFSVPERLSHELGFGSRGSRFAHPPFWPHPKPAARFLQPRADGRPDGSHHERYPEFV